MNRYFTIFHGLVEGAPWGVGLEHLEGPPRCELGLLCRTEAEAARYARQLSLLAGPLEEPMPAAKRKEA